MYNKKCLNLNTKQQISKKFNKMPLVSFAILRCMQILADDNDKNQKIIYKDGGNKMKKVISAALIMVMVLSLITGCSNDSSGNSAGGQSQNPGSSSSKEIKFASPVDVSSLDPRNATGTTTAQILAHIYSSLLKTDANGAIAKDLAESYESVNDTTWKFKLKEGITFHDGSKLTSEDVKYTIDTIKDKDKKFKLASDFSFMTVNVTDELSFEIVTDQPFAALPLRLTYVKIIPKAYVERVGDEEFAKNPVGSGPYKFVERKKDEKVAMEAYENYFGGKPAVGKVTYLIIPEAAARIAALEAGEVDIISNVETSQVERLKSADNLDVIGNPTTRVIFIGMNTLIDSPLKNVKVRQALNYAVDKDAIIKGVLDGYGTQIATISTPQYEGYDSSIAPYEYDPEKAKQLLTEAGYPNGFELKLSVTSGYLNGQDVVQAIAAQLAEVGIKCTVREADSNTQREQIAAGTVDPLYMNGIGGPYSNIDLVTKLSFSTGERYSTYSNPDFDALRLKAAAIVDKNEAAELLSQLQQMAKDEAPAIFLYQQYGLYGYNKRVINWTPRVDEMIVVTDADVQ